MRTLLLFGVAALAVSLASAQEQKKDEPKGDPKKIVAALIESIEQKEDAGRRLQAIMEIAEHVPIAQAAVPGLIDALLAKDEDLKLNAAIALGKIGKPAVAPLQELLSSKDDDARFYAIWA